MAATKIDKAIEAATHDWEADHGAHLITFRRRDAQPAEGYPHLVAVEHAGGGITGGHVMNDYGDHFELGEGPYGLGSRHLVKVLANVHNPFRYKTFFEAWVTQQPITLSEKILAQSINISERQIRKARIMGFMDGYLADRLCIKILGIHPSNLFGFEGWVDAQGPDAWPKERKTRA